MKRLFWAFAGLSLALHGALAIGWQPRAAPAAPSLNHRPPAPLHSRLIVRPSSLPPPALRAAPAAADAAATTATTATTTATTAAQHDLAGPQAPAEPAAEPNPSRISPAPAAAEPAETEREAQAGAPAETEAETAASAAGWDHYYARSQLSVGPSPREHILLGYPDDGPAVGRFMLTLTLYIDEAGRVRRVDVASDQALPDALRQAARLAFSGQRFSPGERAGEVVKSRIRIEVLYESLALPTFAANATAPEGATAH